MSRSESAAEVAWGDVLDALEADLEVAEEAADGLEVTVGRAWTAPVLDTPIPASLEARARALVTRQQGLSQELPTLITQTGQQLRATHHFSSSARRGSVYVDVSA